MSVSPSYKAYVLDQLSAAGAVTARSMFGGVGLYCQGLFFGLIDDDTLYLKVDDATRPEFERAVPRCGPTESRGEATATESVTFPTTRLGRPNTPASPVFVAITPCEDRCRPADPACPTSSNAGVRPRSACPRTRTSAGAVRGTYLLVFVAVKMFLHNMH